MKAFKLVHNCSDCPNAEFRCIRGPTGRAGGGYHYSGGKYPKTQDWKILCVVDGKWDNPTLIAECNRIKAVEPRYQEIDGVRKQLKDIPIPAWCPLPDVELEEKA